MDNLKVIITGCGVKPVKHIFKHKNKSTHNSIFIDGQEYKMNIGTATAYYLLKKDISVVIVSRNIDNLNKIKEGLAYLGCDKNKIICIGTDITNEIGINFLIKKLPKKTSFYWVQSIGMGGGSYKLPNDNVYLPFEKIKPELIDLEMDIVTATHRMMLKIVRLLRKQVDNKYGAKICIITSMSGERGYHFGATHVAAKHALVGYIKGIELELKDEGIEIHDIRPGAIDTGMYDNIHVQKSANEIARRSKLWKGNEPSFAQPMDVAKKVYDSLFGSMPKKVYRILGPNQK